jgi:EAL domain-containing protein (putative c-di-GMP-specific phosphodiesterase class I)
MGERIPACGGCGDVAMIPLSMAFQPIVNIERRAVFAQEALVRGPAGETAASVLAQVTEQSRYAFDQSCRIRAIELASKLGLAATGALLSINFLPRAVYRPEVCIRTTLQTARRTGFPVDRLIFEVNEAENLDASEHLISVMTAYRGMGFRTAIDDFGAGHSGLSLLADFQPDYVKLDLSLIRAIDQDAARRSIVSGLARMCRELGVTIVAEGVETAAEAATLRSIGVTLLQGYLFARPGFETLPTPAFPPAMAPT